MVGENKEVILRRAAKQGDLDVLKDLIEKNRIDVNIQDRKGFTPLFIAAKSGHLDCVKYLVSKGAEINICSRSGTTALWAACALGQTVTASFLKELGADVNATWYCNRTLVAAAAWNGHADSVRLTASFGVDVNKADDDGKTPIYLAAESGKVDCILALHSLGADLNTCSKEGVSPFMAAAQGGSLESVKLFIELGCANITQCDQYGDNAANAAAYGNNMEVISFLAEKGVNLIPFPVEKRLDENLKKFATPVFKCASSFNCVDPMRLFLELGADIDTCYEDEGWEIPPIMAAAKEDDVAAVELLHELGANMELLIAENTYEGGDGPIIAIQEGVTDFLAVSKLDTTEHPYVLYSLIKFAIYCLEKRKACCVHKARESLTRNNFALRLALHLIRKSDSDGSTRVRLCNVEEYVATDGLKRRQFIKLCSQLVVWKHQQKQQVKGINEHIKKNQSDTVATATERNIVIDSAVILFVQALNIFMQFDAICDLVSIRELCTSTYMSTFPVVQHPHLHLPHGSIESFIGGEVAPSIPLKFLYRARAIHENKWWC